MAAIGELSANIAHDFRNPLAAIYGSAQIISLEFDNNSQEDLNTQQRLTNIILRESERMADTVTEFLQFARPAALTYQWFDLKRLTLDTIKQVKDSKAKYADYLFDYSISNHLDIWGDRQQLQITLKHLLVNSCNASENKKNMPVEISGYETIWKEKSIIVIEISDKGSGIPAENKEKIFEPFFSTSEQGTGLGLAIVKQVVNRHHGSMEFSGSEGQGCKVTLRFPLPGSSDSTEQDEDI